jgi:hypothetical protein
LPRKGILEALESAFVKEHFRMLTPPSRDHGGQALAYVYFEE